MLKFLLSTCIVKHICHFTWELSCDVNNSKPNWLIGPMQPCLLACIWLACLCHFYGRAYVSISNYIFRYSSVPIGMSISVLRIVNLVKLFLLLYVCLISTYHRIPYFCLYFSLISTNKIQIFKHNISCYLFELRNV